DEIAAHASGNNAGNLNPLFGTPAALRGDALEAFALHRDLMAELGFTSAPAERIHLGYEESERQELEDIATMFESTEGFSSRWLEGDELFRLEQGLATEFRFGVLTRGNLSVDSGDYTRAIAERALRLGVKILLDEAIGIVTSGARVTGIRTRDGIVPCDEVVFATGPWVADVNAWLGIDVDVEPVKGELLLMRLPEGAPKHDLIWNSAALYRRRGDQLWIGGTMEKNGFDTAPSPACRKFLLSEAARLFPAVERAEFLDHVAALRPVPAANQPIVARAKGWQNVTIANGGGSKGVLWSALIAKKVCDLVMCGDSVSGAGCAALLS
ncbi:MAG TPA: FAD-dependent oxidoreductase, partial [Rhizomicrobium sp.]